MKIIADDTIPYLKGIAEPIADMVYLKSKDFSPEAVRPADALIVRSIDKCSRHLLEGSRVKLITTATIGFDHIDTRFCDEAGIAWRNAPGCNAASVGLYVLASLIAVSLKRGETLRGKTLGIVGVGHVGKIVEHLGHALGMTVLRNDPPRAEQEGDAGFVPLEVIAREADIVSFHVPLTADGPYPTRHLADYAFFRSLARRPWFINSCRGAVHDTEALKAARREGLVSELILDCWENEPNIDRELLDMATIATPHIAGFSADGKANATRMCLEEIERFFHIRFDRLAKVVPEPPRSASIDLRQWDDRRVEHAVLACFDPTEVDRRLREAPGNFEYFRNHYEHPREPQAYSLVGLRREEEELARQVGFRCATEEHPDAP